MKPHEYLYLTRRGSKPPMGCLALCAVLLTALLVAASLLPALVRAEELPLPQGGPERERTAILWFRYEDEPCLAQEQRSLSVSPERPFETALLTALFSGPEAQSASLTGLFPAGSRVLSTVRSGRTLFVTVNQQLMQGAAALGAEERQLCLDAIAATVTENCEVDQVQLLLELGRDSLADSLRMPASFLPGGDSQQPLPPLTRQEASLLTPYHTARRILTLWVQRDWPTLWKYVHHELEGYEDFVQVMEALPALTGFNCTPGSVLESQATFVLEASLLREGLPETAQGQILRLERENALWRVTQEALTAWLREE